MKPDHAAFASAEVDAFARARGGRSGAGSKLCGEVDGPDLAVACGDKHDVFVQFMTFYDV